ncbi:MAG: hypothetical protein Q9219_006766 [cf. Caloplaca sp. 3 TL-2023]
MSVASLEQQLNQPYDIDNWTVQDTIKCQKSVVDFLDLLRNGKLYKSEHQKLVDTFVNWVQQDPFWGLAIPMAPEFREGTVQQDRMQNFPVTNAEDLFHMQEIINKVERIHRPLTVKELQEQKEWEAELDAAGATVVGSPEWYAKMREEHGEEFFGGREAFQREAERNGFQGLGMVVGEPMMFGDILKAGKKKE